MKQKSSLNPTLEPFLSFATEEYTRDALAEITGEQGLDGIPADLNGAISLLMDTADIGQSEA